ncbi:hypothetical protein KGF57_000349 [Candida theae]|uniref:FAD/NAD(P)-binding domain-containing protein n=1 Tax=Candida theae TaxID=1198502 RepID=A0AAD5BJA2_9ASCO|nr:uncharacterized protein KGF57_000349 [Candida theae]KAI5967509.1 hypothetical protein KGF57_000349 [Candida theae]
MTDKSIAIIGAGPGGLAALYEFLHTNADGTSNLTDATKTYKDNIPLGDAFKNIVVFESKDKAGGIWAPATEEADLPVPPQHLLHKVNDPHTIKPTNVPPEGIKTATLENPIHVENEANYKGGKTYHGPLINELEWSRSGIFPFLFTNIPTRFTRYSYLPITHNDKSRSIFPFLTHQELSERFSDFIQDNELGKYIRLNSPVERVEKEGDKWVVTVRKKDGNKSSWYSQSFDYVVVANGHYTLPYIPNIPGLADYNERFPDSLIHAKSFRHLDEFKDKRVLVVGGGISTVNILQYVVPVAKSVTNSKRGPNAIFPYINDALISEPIEPKGTIDHIDGETGEFHFTDGSVGAYDKVIFSTGYHYHFPFFPNNDHFKLINPGNLSRVDGLYLNTFDQHDPTLGAVGITVSQLNFHTIEASGAALAGVWSGAKKLPSLKEQQEWEQNLVAERGNSLIFHYYNQHTAKDFIDAVAPYFPKGRYNPLDVDGPFVGEVDEGANQLEKLFYGLKEGRIRIEETNPSYRGKSEEGKKGETKKVSTEVTIEETGPIPA